MMNQKKARPIGGINRVARSSKKISPMHKLQQGKVQREQRSSLKGAIVVEKSKPSRKIKQKAVPIKRHRPLKKTFSFNGVLFLKNNWYWIRHVWALIFVILMLVAFFNTRAKTTVELRPHHEFISVNESVTLYEYPQENQIGFSIISLSESTQLPMVAEGVQDVYLKAQGEITVFNNHSSEPQRLLPETRFKSAGGKIFHLGNQEVVIPGKKASVPGSVDILVYAAESGPEYNIDNTDFSIPRLKESGLIEKYNDIYAVSKEGMTGGYRGTEKYITEDQRLEVQKVILDTLLKRLKVRLALEKTDNVLIIKGSQDIQYDDLEYMVDENGNEFVLARGRIVSLILGKKDIDIFLEKAIESPEYQYGLDIISLNNIELSLSSGSSFDFLIDSQVSIDIKGSPLVQSIIDVEQLKSRLIGYEESKLQAYFKSIISIDQAKVKISPFWKNKVSPDASKIHISIE
jgi:hypothetical protein